MRNPHNPGGPHVRAEQGSTAYLLHLLRDNPQIAAALARHPEQRDALAGELAQAGPDTFAYFQAELHADETYSTARMRLDPDVLAGTQIDLATTGAQTP